MWITKKKTSGVDPSGRYAGLVAARKLSALRTQDCAGLSLRFRYFDFRKLEEVIGVG